MARTKNFNREEALQRALQLFWCKGYHATSMQDLVDHMQINRSSLYDTFGDKRTVFLEALKQYQQQSTQALINKFTESKDLKATVESVFKTILEEITSCSTKTGCFMVNASIEMASSDPEVDQIIAENNAAAQQAIYLALQKAHDKGEIKSGNDPMALSSFIMNTIGGMRVAARTSVNRTYYENVITVAINAL